MENGEYPQRLQEHLESRDYPPHTIENIGRMARHGSMSHQAALELLEEAENGRRHRDAERSGAVQPIRTLNWDEYSCVDL